MEAAKKPGVDRRITLEFVTDGLTKSGLINPKAAESILQQCSGLKEYPLEILAKFGIRDRRPPHQPLTLEALTEWLAAYCGATYFEIDPLKIDIKSVTQVIPAAYARRQQIIPVKVEAGRILFATAEPFDLEWIPEVQNVVKKKVEIVVSSPKAIHHFIEEFFTVRVATRDFQHDLPKVTREFGRVQELDRMLGAAKGNELGKNATAIVRIVDWLFQFAHDERATDIHMEPKRGKGLVRFRIDGHMRAVYAFEPEIMLPIMSRIKILGEMAVDEKRKPQDGHVRYKLSSGQEMEMRLSTIPTQHGEKLVVRIFDPKMAGRNFADLGFAPADIKAWESLIYLPHGLVLVTGPTGSGKSTTLHTSMRKIATEDVNVCTIEDPIEIVNDDLNQVQVHPKIELTFAEAIRAFLRQDPDIIMVGEIRDHEAGGMAIQAALTGHLVLSTLHTNDAISSITRMIDLDIPAHLISAALRGMMAQRLVRRLCDFCKEKVPTQKEAWEELLAPHHMPMPAQVYQPTGCRECKHTGYRGRLCVYEIIRVDRGLRDVIRKGVTLAELQDATAGKYVPLRVNGAQKVAEGATSIEEVLRVVF